MDVPIKGLELWACEWEDAHYDSGEYTLHEIEHRSVRYVTTGILIRNDDIGVMLANDICETGAYRGLNFVPKAMVVKTWRIGVLAQRIRKPRRIIEQPMT